MGRRPKHTLLQRRHTDDHEPHVKTFNITIREMKIKATMRYHLTPVRMAEWTSSKCLQLTNTREDMEKRKLSYTVGGNVSWYSHHGNQYGGSSEN